MPLPNNSVRGSVTFQQSELKCQRIHQVAGAGLLLVAAAAVVVESGGGGTQTNGDTFIFLSERETTLQAVQPVSSVKFTNENLKKEKWWPVGSN